MFLKMLKAYKELGYDIHLGNNLLYAAGISKEDKMLIAGGGISQTDINFFVGLSRLFVPDNIFVIGNSFGYSTCILAELFPNSNIDVIDFGQEGEFNSVGNDITKKICAKYYTNVQLTQGRSPEELKSAMRYEKYQLVFIDGEHTDRQQLADFFGTLPFAADNCVYYLHDVELWNIQKSFNYIKERSKEFNFSGYNVDFTVFGCKSLVRGYPEIEEWLQFIDKSPVENLNKPFASFRGENFTEENLINAHIDEEEMKKY